MTASTPQTLPLNVALQQAVAHHQAGRLQEAEQLYRAILQAQPYQADANHNLGVLAVQVGQHLASLPYLKTALAVNPAQGQYALSYAEALLTTGQAGEALNVLQAAIKRGFNTPAVQALRQKIEASMLNAAATGAAPTPAEIDRLVDLFNAGQHTELESRARSLLERCPDSGLAWKVLGASLQAQGKEALPALQRSAALLPDDAEAHCNLGIAQQSIGELDNAIASYRRALEIKSDFAEAYFGLGVILQIIGQLDDAVTNYRNALKIKPGYTKVYLNLGVALETLGRFDDALASFRRVLEMTPDCAEAHNNLGNTLKAAGQIDNALASYRLALKIKPDYAKAHYNLGSVLQSLGQFDGAIASFRNALEIKPDYADAHNNMGVALEELGQFDYAVVSYTRALEINPDFADAHANLGNVLQDLGQLDSAVASYIKAIEIKQYCAIAHRNMADALNKLEQVDSALASYANALEINPDSADTRLNRAFCLLEIGRYSEGWPEYEYRWDTSKPKRSRPATALPQWDGHRPASGERLLVFEEQGLGDRLQFARYLPLAAACFPGGVSLVSDMIDGALSTLLRRSFSDVEILEATPSDQSAWQWQCPLLSLPLAFGTTLDTIPMRVPYLIPDPVRVACWQARIAELGLPATTRRIGVVWKTGQTMRNAAMRSLALQQLAPLLDLPGCVWFSLQKEPDPDKAPWVTSGELIDWSEEFGDFDETAALAMNLDLIISVDTAMAHLAGGLGRPTWLLNRHASEWRWMRNREDSLWYPTMRIFTQKKAGEWDEVVRRVATALIGIPPRRLHL